MRRLAPLFLAATLAAVPAAQAQEPPSRVGRVAHIEGQASLYQDPDAGWEKAYVNSPLTSENSVWTDRGSRAELRISGLALRLDELTQLDVARLDEDELDAFVPRGSVSMNVRHYENNERLVFNTPNSRVQLRGNGRYRIDVDHERQETRVTVFAGEARIGTDDGRTRVTAGRSVLIFGLDRPEFVEERAATDAFDRWTLARDERWREGQAPTYVSTYMTGYEDLDAYGQWSTEPEYGALWYPSRVATTWAPYRHGHWSYVRPWGWTWIDDAPWGYAPFHYGRWVYVRNRWAWSPGERVARPVWAPALVAWVGGSNFNVQLSSGPSVGWYPLSPWDRYDPWFNASPTYVNRVNVVVRNDRPTREDRRNWHEWTRERGTTVVNRNALFDRKPIAQAAIPVTVDAIRRAQVARQPESILPSRNDFISRQRQRPQASVPAPTVVTQPAQSGVPASQQPPGRSNVARPDFGRNRQSVAAPQPASAPPGRRPATAQQPVSREERERAVRQQTDQAIRDAQQQGQAQQRAQREAQQAQERAQREAAQQQQQQQQQQQRQAQERAQREAQQAQERAQREAAQQQQQQQQQQQRQAQERAQREAAQQQQQQRQAQERAQRESQQAQERAQREAAQQQQRQQQQQQQQQQRQQPPQSREDRERAVRQQTDQAIRDAQQGQQRQQQQAQERAQREAQQAAREAQRQKDKEKEDEKGKNKEKASKN